MYSRFCKLLSESSIDEPAVLPCGLQPRQARGTVRKQFTTKQFCHIVQTRVGEQFKKSYGRQIWLCPSLRDCLALAEEPSLREEDEVAAPLGDEDLRQVALQRHQRLITVLLALLEETARCFDDALESYPQVQETV